MSLGHHRTSASDQGMSALPLNADMFSVELMCGKVPTADVVRFMAVDVSRAAPRLLGQFLALLLHFVAAEKCMRRKLRNYASRHSLWLAADINSTLNMFRLQG